MFIVFIERQEKQIENENETRIINLNLYISRVFGFYLLFFDLKLQKYLSEKFKFSFLCASFLPLLTQWTFWSESYWSATHKLCIPNCQYLVVSFFQPYRQCGIHSLCFTLQFGSSFRTSLVSKLWVKSFLTRSKKRTKSLSHNDFAW